MIDIKHNYNFWNDGGQHAVEIHKKDDLQMGLYNIKKDTHIGITWEAHEQHISFILYLLEGEMSFHSAKESFTLKTDDSVMLSYDDHAYHGISNKPTRMMIITTGSNYQHIDETNACFEKLRQVELKDVYTIGHSRRVSSYAMSIALEMDSAFNITLLGTAATFHDLGKYHTPIQILQKPSSLNAEEWKIMKQHPLASYQLLIASHGERIATIALQHHERMDGSGYPYALQGEEICLEARIIAVADVFDAITCKRVYNEAVSFDEAYAIMQKEAHLYDQRILAALGKLIKEGRLHTP